MLRTLPENLKVNETQLECPFTWNVKDLVKNTAMRYNLLFDLQNKIKELDKVEAMKDRDEELWYRFTIEILCVYLLKSDNEPNKALSKIEDCCNLLLNIERNVSTNKGNGQELITMKIKQSLRHVFLACKWHIIEDKKERILILADIIPVDKMTNIELAGIEGVKAEIFSLLGHTGHEKAVGFGKKAIALNRFESQWWFITGKTMGRVRRLKQKTDNFKTYKEPELEYLEKAVALKERPSYIVILAQSYNELARYKNHSEQQNMNRKAMELYIKAKTLGPNNPRTLIRCANGLLKLRCVTSNIMEAKAIIDKCLELVPENAYTHHVAGKLYERFQPFQNYSKALEHLETSSKLGNFDATLHYISLKCSLNETYDVLEDLKLAKEKYKEEAQDTMIEKEFGVYYLIKKQDLLTALKHFTLVIQRNNGELLQSRYWNQYPTITNINFLKIVVDEARLFNPKGNEIVQQFLSAIKVSFPGLLQEPCVRNGINLILESNKKYRAQMMRSYQPARN